jgi:hypothetical protein
MFNIVSHYLHQATNLDDRLRLRGINSASVDVVDLGEVEVRNVERTDSQSAAEFKLEKVDMHLEP